MALALRDSGDVDAALDYFLKGQELEALLEDANDSEGDDSTSRAASLGNVARCLQFQGNHDLALRFYVRSAQILEKEESAASVVDSGYAALWIGEPLEKQEFYDSGYMAFRHSENVWSKRAPLRAHDPATRVSRLARLVTDKSVLYLDETSIERAYKKQINRLLGR